MCRLGLCPDHGQGQFGALTYSCISFASQSRLRGHIFKRRGIDDGLIKVIFREVWATNSKNATNRDSLENSLLFTNSLPHLEPSFCNVRPADQRIGVTRSSPQQTRRSASGRHLNDESVSSPGGGRRRRALLFRRDLRYRAHL